MVASVGMTPNHESLSLEIIIFPSTKNQRQTFRVPGILRKTSSCQHHGKTLGWNQPFTMVIPGCFQPSFAHQIPTVRSLPVQTSGGSVQLRPLKNRCRLANPESFRRQTKSHSSIPVPTGQFETTTFGWDSPTLQVEQMGFQHFQVEVNVPNIAIFRPSVFWTKRSKVQVFSKNLKTSKNSMDLLPLLGCPVGSLVTGLFHLRIQIGLYIEL